MKHVQHKSLISEPFSEHTLLEEACKYELDAWWLGNMILMKTQSSTLTLTLDFGLRLRVCQYFLTLTQIIKYIQVD